MKKGRVLIVTAVGMALALSLTLINYFYPFAERSAAFISWLVISPVWAFCVAPAYAYVYYRSNEKSMEENMRDGMLLGLWFGIEFLILPILIAPVLAVMFYVKAFRK